MTERCECCKGRKTVFGLGCMVKKCDNCSGVGHVKIESVDTEKPATIVRVKRTRKPRLVPVPVEVLMEVEDEQKS